MTAEGSASTGKNQHPACLFIMYIASINLMIREPIPCPLNCPLTAKRPIFNAGYEDRLFELGMCVIRGSNWLN